MMASMTRLSVAGFNGDALARLRKAAGMTQEDLAIRIGVSTTSISSWELGRSAPEPANFERLRQVLPDHKGELLREVDPIHGLAEHRARAGLTQAQAAEKSAMTLNALMMVERGVRLPSAEQSAALAKTYDITEDEVKRLATALHEHRKGGGR